MRTPWANWFWGCGIAMGIGAIVMVRLYAVFDLAGCPGDIGQFGQLHLGDRFQQGVRCLMATYPSPLCMEGVIEAVVSFVGLIGGSCAGSRGLYLWYRYKHPDIFEEGHAN